MTEVKKTRCINLDNTTFSLSPNDIHRLNIGGIPAGRIDERMDKFFNLKNWKLFTKYKNHRVDIPDFPGSSFHLVKYFKVVKKPGDPFYNDSEEENEIGCTIWAGWPGYDHEVEINLFISGKDVLSGKDKISAEILKCGSASMVLTFRDKIVTDFKKRSWYGTKQLDKVWIDSMTDYL